MTLVVDRSEVVPAVDNYGPDLSLAKGAVISAARFIGFINGNHYQEAHKQFYLNHNGYPGDQIAHSYFLKTLLLDPKVSAPEEMEIADVIGRPELDGKSVALYRNDNLGLFIARQVFILDRIPAPECDRYVPPPEGSLLVDYYAGQFKPQMPITLL